MTAMTVMTVKTIVRGSLKFAVIAVTPVTEAARVAIKATSLRFSENNGMSSRKSYINRNLGDI